LVARFNPAPALVGFTGYGRHSDPPRYTGAESTAVTGPRELVTFFPTKPATLGHTLVIPHDHMQDIWALDDRTATKLARVTLGISTRPN
jgi:diadenosine tetraphosphate (Ap4A) HIT family hydrolase